MTAPPYLARIVALYAAGGLRRGQVHQVDVLHDDWCPRLRGGDCQCTPDLALDGRRVEMPTS